MTKENTVFFLYIRADGNWVFDSEQRDKKTLERIRRSFRRDGYRTKVRKCKDTLLTSPSAL